VERLQAGYDHADDAPFLRLLGDPALAGSLGAHARLRARDFTCEGAVAQYERLFTELLK
jgi:hypothetical protein